ncbi:hypothetical protein RJ640_005421 [Escallonia rubra]|uniref:CSC1-like protein ERD4 n=1 Tax=Escallonia rubra TaxID=112253 RepID=A0AA88QLM6_9ASTE|nr:hypothetical protein RJ640_005421 [Escallonia rubra]
MDFVSFLTSSWASFTIFVILMLLFPWLSRKPGNDVIYYPNRILRGLDPFENGARTRSPFAWIREALSSSEEDVIAISSVDTAVYFVFLTTVAATANYAPKINSTSNRTFTHLNALTMAHIEPNSPRLWAFVIATYWVSFVTYFLLWKAYKRVSGLRAASLITPQVRAASLITPQVRAEQFSVLVRDIPPSPEGRRKEQVDTYFKTIYPESFYRSMVVTENKQVNKIWVELEGYKKKLAHAEVVYAVSKKTCKPEGTRPINKTGLFGLSGQKVDTIEYCNEKIHELIPKLEAEQKATLRDKQQASALVFFTSRVTAAAAAQSLHAPMVDTWTVMDAPEPGQIIWTNLTKSFYERQIRQYVVYIIVLSTIVFSMIPIGFITAFTTLKNLKNLLPFLEPIIDRDGIRTVLEAYLPQIALKVFLTVLRRFLLFLSKAEGIPSESHAIRAASGKYFYFVVLNVFVGVTAGGTVFSTVKTQNCSFLPLLGTNLPANATFFLTYVALQ